MSVGLLTAQMTDAAPANWAGVWRSLQAYWPVLASAMGATLLLTPVMRKLALANGIVDLPDARRKAHAKPVAYLGGLAIFLGWFLGISAFIVLMYRDTEGGLRAMLGEGIMQVVYIVVGAVAIVLTGLVDDVYGIRARVKIGGQLFAAAAIAQAKVVNDLVLRSFEIMDINAHPVILQMVGTAMLAVLVVGCCNALNLIDGLDGLASGVTAVAMAGMLAICLVVMANNAGDALILSRTGIPIVLCLATIGAVAGFLPYNFNPASIFMGDAGSLLLGYLCVTTILFMGRFDNDAGLAPLAFTGAVVCFALPLTDTALAIVRRKLSGKPIFAPDAMHMHHMFRRCGFSVKQTTLAMYGIGLVFAAIGVMFVALSVQWKSSMAVFLATVGVILVTGVYISRRLERNVQTHPKPAEAPDPAPGNEPSASATADAAAG